MSDERDVDDLQRELKKMKLSLWRYFTTLSEGVPEKEAARQAEQVLYGRNAYIEATTAFNEVLRQIP